VRALQVRRHGEPPDALEVSEVAVPDPGPGQVRLRVGAAALNMADLLLCRGGYQLSPPVPFTPGMEAAGVVEAVGPDAAPGLLGTRVVGVPELPHGALAEEAILVAARSYPLPDEMDDDDAAAMLIAFTTAHVALHRRAGLREGESLLVHAAAGGAGSAAVQLGVVAGARVIATAGGPDKVAECINLGADAAIDYRAESVADRVLELTGGRGADVVFDPVGGEVFEQSQRCVANEGRILLIGFAGGDVQSIPANQVLLRNQSVIGVYLGAYNRTEADLAFLHAVHAELVDLVLSNRVAPVVSRQIGLEEVASALVDLGARRTVGKIVVHP
jgi:NADPH2:quinone reductase